MEKRRENFYDQQKSTLLNHTWFIGFLSMFYLDDPRNSA